MSAQSPSLKEFETLKKKLEKTQSSKDSLDHDFKYQSSLLISFINKLSLTSKGIDSVLDNKLAKLRQTFAKSGPISEVEKQIKEITLILNNYSLENEKNIGDVHNKLKDAGISLQKHNGLPSELRRTLRTLLLETELHKDAVIQYIPYLTRLLGFYNTVLTKPSSTEVLNTTPSISVNTDVSTSLVNDELIQRFTKILNTLNLSKIHSEKISQIKLSLDKDITNDILLDSFLNAFDVIIEDLQEEKNTAKAFLYTLSETLSKVQTAVKKTLNLNSLAGKKHDKINEQLQEQVKEMSTCVEQATSLSNVKNDINTQLELIVNSLDKKSHLEQEQQKILTSQLNEMKQKVTQLEEESVQFEKRIKEQQIKSLQDALTKLGNRAAFDEHFSKEIVRFHHKNFDLAIAVLDLDDFKRINDTYGHTAGDKTLQVIANTLKKNLSKVAFIGRYGGEEFVLVFSEINKTDVLKKLTDLKQKIARLPFKFKDNNVSITTSIGVSHVNKEDNVHLAFERADQALYEAKNQGKNTIVYR